MSRRQSIERDEPRAVTLRRRVKSIPIVLTLFVVVTALLPLVLLVAAVADIYWMTAKKKPAVFIRVIVFSEGYLIAEFVGMIALLVTWIVSLGGRNQPILRGSAFWVQQAWAGWMMWVAVKAFRIKLEVEGRDNATPGPYIEFIRHSSIVDNVLSAVTISGPLRIELNYVLKRELLADPCFDIAGRRLTNHFVNRDSGDPREIDRVRALTSNLSERQGALIYPEGTRVSDKRRLKALKAIGKNRPERAEKMSVLKYCLPPRHGGPLALLDAAPEVDVVLVVHAGLEGMRGIKDVIDGGLVDTRIVVQIVRVPRASIPAGLAAADWLDDTWIAIDRWVGEAVEAIEAGGTVPAFTVPEPVTV